MKRMNYSLLEIQIYWGWYDVNYSGNDSFKLSTILTFEEIIQNFNIY